MSPRVFRPLVAAALLASCSVGSTVSAPSSSSVVAAPSSAGPSSTGPNSTGPATTAAAVTTAAATTVPESLPVPADVPNENAVEPHVVLGSIEIPRLHVSKQLLEGVTLGVLDEAPGHWPGTALPGHLGNVVVAGHRTVFDHPFHDIDQLRKGDEVVFTTAEGRFLYRVTGTEIVTPDAMRIIDQTRDHTATLFACHPLGSVRERIVVHLALA